MTFSSSQGDAPAGPRSGTELGPETEEIVLDLGATDDPLHGHQLDRFFHGCCKNYCFLPPYIFATGPL